MPCFGSPNDGWFGYGFVESTVSMFWFQQNHAIRLTGSCHAGIGDLVLELLQVLQEDGLLGPSISVDFPVNLTIALP